MNQQAVLQLIDKAGAEQWRELDLSGLALTEIPLNLTQLKQLKKLILGKWDSQSKKSIGN